MPKKANKNKTKKNKVDATTAKSLHGKTTFISIMLKWYKKFKSMIYLFTIASAYFLKSSLILQFSKCFDFGAATLPTYLLVLFLVVVLFHYHYICSYYFLQTRLTMWDNCHGEHVQKSKNLTLQRGNHLKWKFYGLVSDFVQIEFSNLKSCYEAFLGIHFHTMPL